MNFVEQKNIQNTKISGLKDVVPYNIAMKFSARKNVPWRCEVCWWHRGFHGERQLGEHPTWARRNWWILCSKGWYFRNLFGGWWNWNRNIFLIGFQYRCTLSSAIEEIDYRELGVGKATFARFFFCVAVRWVGVRQTRFCCQGPLMTFYLYRVDNDQRWGLLSRATGGRCWPPMTGTNSTAWTWPTSWVMCGNWSMTRNQGDLHAIFAMFFHCWFAKHIWKKVRFHNYPKRRDYFWECWLPGNVCINLYKYTNANQWGFSYQISIGSFQSSLKAA